MRDAESYVNPPNDELVARRSRNKNSLLQKKEYYILNIYSVFQIHTTLHIGELSA